MKIQTRQRSVNVRFQSEIIRKSTTLNWEEYGVTVEVKAEEAARGIFLGCCEANDLIIPQEGYELVSPAYLIATTEARKAEESDKVEIRMESFACISSPEEELCLLHYHLYGSSADKYMLSQLIVEGDVYNYKEDSPVPLSMTQLPALLAVARRILSGIQNI